MRNIDIMNNVNRAGFGSTITTGGGSMAHVATEDQYVEDVHGIRRLIKKGDAVPVGLFDLADVKTEEVDTRSLARPVVDLDASQPSGTAADPKAGIDHSRSQELQEKARSGTKPKATASAAGK